MKRTNRRQVPQLGAGLGSGMLARADETRTLGKPLSGYSERSPFVKAVRVMR